MFNFNYILELYQRLLLQIFETAISQQTLIGYIAKKKKRIIRFHPKPGHTDSVVKHNDGNV